MSASRHDFESASSTQTLAQGLQEYFASNPGLKRGEALAPAARRFFAAHDAVHVVYGCGTSMPDEAIVKLTSVLGTTGGWSILRGYLHHDVLDIYRKLPWRDTALAMLASPYLIVRTAWRCTRQRHRWPWEGHERYLDRPLADIRAEFGIRVTHADRRGVQA